MLNNNISQLNAVIESDIDEMTMIRQIIAILSSKLKISFIVADKKNNSIVNVPFKSEDYFFKIPIKVSGIKYGMIYANGMDKLTSDGMALFNCAVPLISILLRDIYMRNDLSIKRQIKSSRTVIGSLTITELKAIKAVFEAIDKTGGIVNVSNIANKISTTRSIIVNALKKIESAGIIDTRSLGMKGTKISIINKYFINELKGY
jgi:GTP-sensing transcriptional pleiotropic repressor codY